ncbi:ABC transporter substrate-binding protein [Paenibacillus alba]|uniref:ABC transporter substrate-binding protein n=1 Tax=Paenibacillus alba TaxID=1197127 RepID=A0ABU6FXA0_9BACL|nr:ABC transporter substrate-binding protein [Paenibacillus alba]MEC0226533.1 ABC transporter substrate-binding protein [Paenibacillus alba]
MKPKNKLKTISGMFTIFALVGVLAGCGTSSSTTTETAKPVEATKAADPTKAPAKGVTIKVASSAGWTKDIDKKLAEQFKTETGNTIEFVISPDDQYTNVLKAKFATGEGPDVYLTSSGVAMNEYLPDQHALDLSNEPWVSRYTDWAKAGTTRNGKVIALNTWSVDGWGLLYNTALFEQAGVQVPTNYQEFLKVCEMLTAKGITPIYEPGKAEWHQEIWLNTFGAMIAKKTPAIYEQFNTNKAKFADQKELEIGLTQMKEVADKGYFGKDFLSQTWENSVDAMGSGKYAMMLTYSTFQNEVIAKFPNSKADTWKMFPVPLSDNKSWATSSGGIVRSINKDSKVIDAAKAYFNFLAKADNLKVYYAGRPDLGPTSFKDVEGKTTLAYSTVMANAKDGAGLDFEGGVQFFNQSTIGKAVQDLYLGGKTPKQVLESIDADRAKMFK